MKNYEQYNYILDTWLRVSGELSILIWKKSKVKWTSTPQTFVISVTLPKTVSICSFTHLSRWDTLISLAKYGEVKQQTK